MLSRSWVEDKVSHWKSALCVICLASLVPFAGCDRSSSSSNGGGSGGGAPSQAAGTGAAGQDGLVKLSQFGGSLYCSIAQSPDGTLHAIYTDRANPTRVMFLYYRASKDGGTTWTEPKTLSDDESGLSTYYCRVAVDGKGRVYAIWKYLTAASDTLDGPGSAACGILAFRCLDGGTWSKTVRLSTKKVPSTSFFAANGPGGAVNLVWACGNPDVDWEPKGGVGCQSANMIQQAVLDGGGTPTPKALIAPKPLPTKEQIDAAHAAGQDIPYQDQYPKADGLWNLRGYVDKSGVAHFVGEHYSIRDANGNSSKEFFVEWDGTQLHKLFEVDSGIDFNNPPTLLLDANGKEHLIRRPEHTEKQVVRDHLVENGELGDHTDVVAPEQATGSIVDWQASQLPGGRMAVTCALSQKGGWGPDDVELYVSTSTGDGKWTTPINITNNAARAAFMSKQTSAGGVLKSDNYRPDFAEAVGLKDGGLGVLMVNTDKSIIGITNSGVTGSGQTVGSLATGSTSSPWVFFRRI